MYRKTHIYKWFDTVLFQTSTGGLRTHPPTEMVNIYIFISRYSLSEKNHKGNETFLNKMY
jgi:hypothetical protein